MSSERTKTLVVLSCALVLGACPRAQDDPQQQDRDAAVQDAEVDEPSQPSKPGHKPGSAAQDAGPTPTPKPEPQPGSKPSTEEPSPAPSKSPLTPGPGPSTPQPGSKPGAMGGGAMTPSAAGGPFFLPTPEPRNTQFPRIAIDAKGGLHAAYPAYAGSGAFYAYCPNNCVDPKAMTVVELPTDAIPNSALLALTKDGRPRVLIPTYLHVYYAQCDRECTDAGNWTTSMIVDHQSQQEVTGDALALDSQGHPRFIMHTYVAYLGVGQKEPHTYYAQCDVDCNQPEKWRIDSIQDQMWQYSSLHIDAADRVHLGMIVIDPASSVKQVAYARCDGDCDAEASWTGILLAPAFELSTAEIKPSLSLALTSSGGARVAALVMPEPGARSLVYFECDAACDEDNWNYAVLSEAYELGSGVDLALDVHDRPRLSFTLNHNIGVYHCDDAHCTDQSAAWDLAKVEFVSDLTPDTIILWPNCVADAWYLHDPTLTLTADGSLRVGYMATDVSGGINNKPDPTMTPCLLGKDMTLARMASLPAL